MHPVIQARAKQQLHYNFYGGPDRVRSWDDAKQYGLNCGALVQLLVQDLFHLELPPRLHPLEMLHDAEYFETLSPPYRWQVGDVAFFGKAGIAQQFVGYTPTFDADGLLTDWASHPHLHLTFCANVEPNNQPIFVHAVGFRNGPSGRERDVHFWHLHDFVESASYRDLYAVRRLKTIFTQGSK